MAFVCKYNSQWHQIMPFRIHRPISLYLLLTLVTDSVVVSVLYSMNKSWQDLFGTDDDGKLNSNSNGTKTKTSGLATVVNDVVLLTYLKGFLVVLLVSVLILFPTRYITAKYQDFVYWVTLFVGVLLACKVTLFDAAVDIASYIPIVALGFTAVEFVLLWKTYGESKKAQDNERSKKLAAGVDVVIEVGENPGNDEFEPEEGEEEKKTPVSLFQLLTLLKPYFWPKGYLNKLRCFLTWVFVIISRIANLYAPIFIGNAVAKLSDPTTYTLREVYIDIVLFCMITLLGKYSGELVRVVYLRVKQVAYVEVAEKTFRHLHSLSLEWHLKKKMGSILRSLDRGINAANTVVQLVFLRLLPSIGECIAVFVIFYTTFDLPLLSATVLLSTVLYIVVTVQVTLWRKKFRVETNKHDNQYHDKASDSIINYETVKYFTAEDFEVRRYVDSIEQYQVFSKCTEGTLSLLNMTQQTIIQMTLFSCLYIVATEIFDADANVSIGDFVTVQVYIMNLFAPLSFLGSIYNTVIQSIVDMTNLSELLGESPDVVDGSDAKPMRYRNSEAQKGLSISFNEVWFSYPSNPTSGLKNLSFDVPAGTTTAIVGHTGAGKSTISRLLFRFYDPVEGAIFIGNQNVADITQLSLRQAIGVVPQDTVLFNDTIQYNILYGRRDASMEEIEDACRAAQILDFIHSLPEGFDSMVGERGLKLSGGEKQRVAIARCLLKNPPIVLLDEATSALDTRTEKSVQEALNNLTTSRTTVVIAHRLSTIRDADQILVLDKGEILEKGSHDQLLSLNGEYAQMWAAQRSKNDA